MPALISLNQIRDNNPSGLPCKNGWVTLLKGLGKTAADDELFPITFVLDNNGVEDAFWCVDCLRGYDYAVFNLKADVVESVLHIFEEEYPNDPCVRDCITVTRAFALGEVTLDDLRVAQDFAWDAESNAAGADLLAASFVAESAAVSDMYNTSRTAAAAAVFTAESEDGQDAARDAELQKQSEMFRKWLG